MNKIQGIKQFNYPVKDLAGAKKLYSKLLGVEPYADEAYYVGFRVGDQDIGLDPNGHKQGMTGPVGYFHVSDIKTRGQYRKFLGYTASHPPERAWRWHARFTDTRSS